MRRSVSPCVALRLAPATKILLWLMLAASMQWFDGAALLTASVLLACALAAVKTRQFGAILRRTRWLLLSLILIYAFTTPGEAWLPAWGAFSPTPEGATAGALQAWRIGLLLAALALLLCHCDRECILGGIYVLLRPFHPLGVDAERIAARIWLTLYYAEHEAKGGLREWWHWLKQPAFLVHSTVQSVALSMERRTWRDAVALFFAAAVLAALTRL